MNTLYSPAAFDKTDEAAAEAARLDQPRVVVVETYEPVALYETPVSDAPATLGHEVYTTRSLGPKYPPHDMNAAILGGLDVAGLLAAAVITLGPLAAYAGGLGL